MSDLSDSRRKRQIKSARAREHNEFRIISTDYSNALHVLESSIHSLLKSLNSLDKLHKTITANAVSRHRILDRIRPVSNARIIANVSHGLLAIIINYKTRLEKLNPPADNKLESIELALGKIYTAHILLQESVQILNETPINPGFPDPVILLGKISAASKLLIRTVRRWQSVSSTVFASVEDNINSPPAFE